MSSVTNSFVSVTESQPTTSAAESQLDSATTSATEPQQDSATQHVSFSNQPFRLTEKSLDDVFNDVWANNANAISHCYSNTDALKVDFTRTGKRSLMGMINDATNSVYRMVQGAVTDFFRQTVIDFVYGSIGLHGLERYYDDLHSRDPSEAVRLARVRASAIESCRREVLSDAAENWLGGWTLCSPLEPNHIQSLKLEEKVVLLTSKALYVCSYDFGAEKLSQFTKVLVGDITAIKEGLYIISPHEGNHPQDNWGFVITYLNDESRRNTTASIKNVTTSSVSEGTSQLLLAFRAISDEIENDADANSTTNMMDSTSHQIVTQIIDLLIPTCIHVGACDESSIDSFLTHETIQSLEQAKANISLFAPLIENLKRRLWL